MFVCMRRFVGEGQPLTFFMLLRCQVLEIFFSGPDLCEGGVYLLSLAAIPSSTLPLWSQIHPFSIAGLTEGSLLHHTTHYQTGVPLSLAVRIPEKQHKKQPLHPRKAVGVQFTHSHLREEVTKNNYGTLLRLQNWNEYT